MILHILYYIFFPYTTLFRSRIAEYIKVNNYDIRKKRIKWLISLLSTHDMVEINDRFYDFVDLQPRMLQEQENHPRSEEHTSELQSRGQLVFSLLLEKKKTKL